MPTYLHIYIPSYLPTSIHPSIHPCIHIIWFDVRNPIGILLGTAVAPPWLSVGNLNGSIHFETLKNRQKNDTGSSAAHDWCAGHISLGHRWRDSQLWNVNEMKRTLTSIPLLLILAMNLPILVRSGCLDVIVVKKKNQIWLPPNPMVSHPQVHGVSIWWHRHTFPCGESSAPRCHTVNALDDWIYIGISIVA